MAAVDITQPLTESWGPQRRPPTSKPPVTSEERVVIRTRYPGQALRVVLEHVQERRIPGTDDAVELRVVGQAELVVEAGYRLVAGRCGLRIERIR